MPKCRGITAARAFQAKDLVAVYDGELVDNKAAKKREDEYLKDRSGSYMFFFDSKSGKMW